MNNIKINMSFQVRTWQRLSIESIIRQCIRATFREEGITVPLEINVLITDDESIRAINAASRNIDKATDVLSFPMFDLIAGDPPEDWSDYIDPDTGLCPIGDMAISLERAKEQARSFGHSLKREVGYLTIHSMLHLLGYDHLDEGPQKAQMRAREEIIATKVPGVERT